MNIIPPSNSLNNLEPAGPPKKKRGRPPTNKEAQEMLQKVNETQEQNDLERAELERKRIEEEELERIKKINQLKIIEAQEKVKRAIRAAEKKRLEKEREQNTVNELEKSFGKIKWKSSKSGYLIQGYYKEKLVFEIKRTLFFNLYFKDKLLMEKHKTTKSYSGCSMILKSLKERAEKLL